MHNEGNTTPAADDHKQWTKKALISVSNKQGLDKFAKALADLGYTLISTGGTANALEQAGVPVQRVEDLTGFPEIMDGRVKTLHPKIHAGILARLPLDDAQLKQLGIGPIDIVAVNLYPFRETIARGGVSLEQAIEQIDIGGPSILRAAAKNFARVTVVVNPESYPQVIKELRHHGSTSLTTRLRLAREAFWHTAVYDTDIANYLYGYELDEESKEQRFPLRLALPLAKLADLRYGENPHQQAAFYRDETSSPHGVAGACQLQGKELSFNNILDLDAALRIASEFQATAAVVIKHNKPSGVACATLPVDAFRRARDADPVAAYGGIICLNRIVDRDTAAAIKETFLEAAIAPAFSAEAIAILSAKPELRLLAAGEHGARRELDVKRVSGGFLLQDPDSSTNLEQVRQICRVVTSREPTAEAWSDLLFAWAVVKHAASNGIVLARHGVTLGIGQGQVSRIDAVNIALAKVDDRAKGSVLASDGFLPFADAIHSAAAAGVTALIQPGGSIRDQAVIDAAEAAGMAMVFTGKRHFKH